MANGVNKVILIGRLGSDPEMRHFDSGTALARFSVATTESFRDRDGNKQDRTEWHNIVIWGKLAEIADKYLKKGDQVYLEGSLRTRSYEKDGVTKYVTEVNVRDMTMLGGKPGGAAPAASQQTEMASPQTQESQGAPDPEDDLPF